MNLLFQPGRQRSAAHQLLFESRWQAVFLREARGKIVAASVVPVVNFLVMPVIVAAVFVPIIIPMFIFITAFSVSMALAVALRKRVLAKKTGSLRALLRPSILPASFFSPWESRILQYLSLPDG